MTRLDLDASECDVCGLVKMDPVPDTDPIALVNVLRCTCPPEDVPTCPECGAHVGCCYPNCPALL